VEQLLGLLPQLPLVTIAVNRQIGRVRCVITLRTHDMIDAKSDGRAVAQLICEWLVIEPLIERAAAGESPAKLAQEFMGMVVAEPMAG